MTYNFAWLNIKRTLNKIDWKLLLFLMLFLNVKLAVKIPAIIVIYLLRFNFRFGFSFKNSRLPLFYLLIIAIAFVALFINISYANPSYFLVFFTGMVFWLLCILAIHQVKLSVENNDTETIHNTILVFFVVNAVLSFFNIAHIVWETGALNPYRYQGEYQKYFIGTGDYIRGLTFDTSTTNAVLSTFGVIYFLMRKKPVMMLVCMAVLLLTGCNFMNIDLPAIFLFLFLFKSSKDQKSLIAACFMFLVVFMAKVSPQNDNYVIKTVKNIIYSYKNTDDNPSAKKPDRMPAAEGQKRQFATKYLDSVKYELNKKETLTPVSPVAASIPKTDGGRILIGGPNNNKLSNLSTIEATPEEKQLLTFIDNNRTKLPISGQNQFKLGVPGKVTGVLQTANFFRDDPVKIIAGDGMGNFSSKLAFRATALGFAGGYPYHFAYISKEFLKNHLDLYLNFFSKQPELHSFINSPYSVYDQVVAEYGLLGLVAFIVFYVGFFAKHYKHLTYGIPLLIIMLGAFFLDYWFEQLSVIVFFELLLLLNIKETTYPEPVNV